MGKHKLLLVPGVYVLSALFLSACQMSAVVGTNPAYSVIPVGSKLIVNEPITISAGNVKVFIQSGNIKNAYEVNRFYPNCRLEKRTLTHDKDTVVQPDTFLIISIKRESGGYTHLAPQRQFAAAAYVSGGMPNPESYDTVMTLASEKQPDVFRLTCTHLEDPSNAYHLTLDQIRNALGKVITLEVGTGN